MQCLCAFIINACSRDRYSCSSHSHMRISAQGYRTIGVTEGTFDIVLEPEP
jgi:hypothetical protein